MDSLIVNNASYELASLQNELQIKIVREMIEEEENSRLKECYE